MVAHELDEQETLDERTEILLQDTMFEVIPGRGHIEYHLGKKLLGYENVTQERAIRDSVKIVADVPLAELCVAIQEAREDLAWMQTKSEEPLEGYDISTPLDQIITPLNTATENQYWSGYIS